MQRGGVEPCRPGEQAREEPLDIAQERALTFDAPKLLEEGQGDNLGVRKPLERLVAVGTRVEQRIGVVDEAEKDGQGLFRPVEA